MKKVIISALTMAMVSLVVVSCEKDSIDENTFAIDKDKVETPGQSIDKDKVESPGSDNNG